MNRFKMKLFIAMVVVTVCSISESNGHELTQNQTWPSRNVPGLLNFPLVSEFFRFGSILSGPMITPHDLVYGNLTLMWNLRVIQSPFAIILPITIQDIQRTILLAREFNMHLSIRSSGHSFIGRSTHDGSITINMAKMREITVNLNSSRSPAGEITVQSGASWYEVYKKVNETEGPDETGSGHVGRVVIGGSAHTVAMGGYTQGGGHAPICRKLGLAVDNLLEATIVTADGRVMTVTADKTIIRELNGTTHESSDTSLFWAIRGGGGGTWGVVVTFTFKLHYAPKRFRLVRLSYPLFSSTGTPLSKTDVTTALSEVNKLSEDWGGYVISSGAPMQKTPYIGYVFISLIHYGNDSSPSNKEVDTILQKTKPIYTSDQNYRTFFDYEAPPKDGPNGNTYIANTFIKRSTLSNTTTLKQYVDFIYDEAKKDVSCTMTMVGGKVLESNKRPATPMHPGIRSGIFSASCGIGWNYNPAKDAPYIEKALDMAVKLYPFGYGSYFNEPAQDMPDWKQRFWADDVTYDRLLKIKQKYDPDNFFWCHNCVGSDRGYQYGHEFSQGVPGKPSYLEFDYTIVLK